VIGVPPSLAEQQAFLPITTQAVLDQVVTDLLARPAYGERWGRHWLDLVRYAETNGYERGRHQAPCLAISRLRYSLTE
jgi:hypothetical protein